MVPSITRRSRSEQLVQVGNITGIESGAELERAIEINRKSGRGSSAWSQGPRSGLLNRENLAVKVSGIAPLGRRRHPAKQLRRAPFDRVSRLGAKRQKGSGKGFKWLRRTQTCAF